MKKVLLTLVITSIHTLLANMGPQGFFEYTDNRVFVETGTCDGNGVQLALNAGFQKVHSIEIDLMRFQRCTGRFKGNNNVHIVLGDSSIDLAQMIKNIHEPITFWLDGHYCPPREDGGLNCPLIAELEQIRLHPIKTHTILIDDMHCTESILFDYLTKEDLKAKILEINPEYEITYVPGGDEGEYPQNVMVARVPKRH